MLQARTGVPLFLYLSRASILDEGLAVFEEKLEFSLFSLFSFHKFPIRLISKPL